MSKPVFEDIYRFSGRRNRKSYVLYGLSMSVLLIVIWALAIGLSNNGELTMTVIAGLVSVAAAVSGWAVGAQRCRDFGWTGWATLLALIPFVGWVFALAMLFIPGTPGPNRYGPSPLREDSVAFAT